MTNGCHKKTKDAKQTTAAKKAVKSKRTSTARKLLTKPLSGGNS